MTTHEDRDVVIVGGGPAGLSAGLVLARAQARVLVVDAGEPRNAPARHMHGYLSRDGMSPSEFAAIGRREVLASGGSLVPARVNGIGRRADGGFEVGLSDGSTEVARAILVTTGVTDEIPEIPGIRERWGTLVHHCPYCHGYEVRHQTIAVIGGPSRGMSIKQAGLLRRYSDQVAFITNGIELEPSERRQLEDSGVRVIDGTVASVARQPGSLDGVVLTEGLTVECEAMFIAPRFHPADELLGALGCAVDRDTGLVHVDGTGQTSVPGVWAAGNVVNPGAQIITAAGAGSAAAIAINGWLLFRGRPVRP